MFVNVENLSPSEIETMIDYFEDSGWIVGMSNPSLGEETVYFVRDDDT